MKYFARLVLVVTTACGGESAPETDVDGGPMPGVFQPPTLECTGDICAWAFMGGCAPEGMRFTDVASCDAVRTQRPYWSAEPPALPSDDDPRLDDAAFVDDLVFTQKQAAACGCVCCHDKTTGVGAAGWDVSVEPIWTDTLTDRGVAILSGRLSSDIFGWLEPEDNYGFERRLTGLPSTDPERMRAFFDAEIERRGITEQQIAAMRPVGQPLVEQMQAEPKPCALGRQGIEAGGKVRWTVANARYVYLLEQGSRNPGPPPTWNTPAGTLWQLDVSPSAAAIASGIQYGAVPAGATQVVPADGSPPPALVSGRTYKLVVLRDVGFALTNCTFEFQ
jgi:hypothetical protein